jgi:hypothetical protein
MKSILIDVDNKIWDVVEPGEEFEVFDGEPTFLKWAECSEDDVTISMVKKEDGTFSNPAVDHSFTDAGRYASYVKNREIAYGSIGEQLDLMYKDLTDGTTLWKDKVESAKAVVPKVTKPADWEESIPEPILEPPTR